MDDDVWPRVELLERVVGRNDARLNAISRGFGGAKTREQWAEAAAVLGELEKQLAEPVAEYKAQRRRAQRNAALDYHNFPLTTADLSMLEYEKFADTRSLRVVRQWLTGDRPLLVLSGPVGRGKSFAAAVALIERAGRYVRAGMLARLFLAQFGEEVAEREQLISAAGLLVVDDIGTEQRADLMGTALIEALDARRHSGRRNLWVTNLARADFERRYPDPRLLSRMAQSALWGVDVGEDLRTKGGE